MHSTFLEIRLNRSLAFKPAGEADPAVRRDFGGAFFRGSSGSSRRAARSRFDRLKLENQISKNLLDVWNIEKQIEEGEINSLHHPHQPLQGFNDSSSSNNNNSNSNNIQRLPPVPVVEMEAEDEEDKEEGEAASAAAKQ